MDNNLEVMVKNVYGNDLIYPQCEQAKKLANFKGTKTFTDLDLKRFNAMGYEFNTATHTLDTHVYNLRKKLRKSVHAKSILKTDKERGYYLV